MPKSPKSYSLILFLLILTLASCELRRDDASDPGAVGQPATPTLASLGADSADLPAEATPIPTVINVQPTATESLLGEGQAAENPNEPSAPTAQPIELMAATPISDNQAENTSVTTEAVVPETFVPPAEAEKASAEEAPIIVNATSTELPDGGPAAANPPAVQPNSYGATQYNETTYLVQAGDTLFSLGQRYGTTVEAFVYANNLTSDFIYEGQVLNIPTGEGAYPAPSYETQPTYDAQPGYDQPVPGNEGGYHMVSRGETLFSIAQWYGTSVEAIAGVNGLAYPYLIYEGQYLTIPAYGATPGFTPPPTDGGFYPPQDPTYPAPAEGYNPPQDPTYTSPGMAGTHTVAPGETLFSIAGRYGTSAQSLAVTNGLANPNQIYVGQVLYLP